MMPTAGPVGSAKSSYPPHPGLPSTALESHLHTVITTPCYYGDRFHDRFQQSNTEMLQACCEVVAVIVRFLTIQTAKEHSSALVPVNLTDAAVTNFRTALHKYLQIDASGDYKLLLVLLDLMMQVTRLSIWGFEYLHRD
jgi:hypothetical protein